MWEAGSRAQGYMDKTAGASFAQYIARRANYKDVVSTYLRRFVEEIINHAYPRTLAT
jgi:hypothetical protein